MRKVRIKVCGMRDHENIRDVLKLQPDFMGFIFFKDTPRYVGEDFLMPENISASTRKVGVFVNESTSRILQSVRTFNLDYVQLHGQESSEQCAGLKDAGVRVIKVFSVDNTMDFEVTKKYAGFVEYFLFDTKGKHYGGNAKRFDWNILSQYDQSVPFFLSGGIGPEHAEEILRLPDYNVAAIDVNSGVETKPAFKDVEKIKAIMAMLKTKQ